MSEFHEIRKGAIGVNECIPGQRAPSGPLSALTGAVDTIPREARDAQNETEASERVRRAAMEFNVAVSAAAEIGLRIDAEIEPVQQLGRATSEPRLAVTVYREI